MKLILVGATGLVGSHVLEQALDDDSISQINVLTRRPLNVEQHPKLNVIELNFDQLLETADWWQVDAVICTLGTTIHKAQTKAKFRQVDYEYPLAIAKLAHQHGVECYVLNSAIGANSESRIFYNQVKGDLENALAQVGFASLYFVRPGLIHGKREEKRLGEQILINASLMFAPILPKKFRVNPAQNIAKALLESAHDQQLGKTVINSKHLI